MTDEPLKSQADTAQAEPENTPDSTAEAAANAPSEGTQATPNAEPNAADKNEASNEMARTEELMAQLEAARQEAKANLEGWQRARAEFMNYKKRVERELSQAHERAALDTLGDVLPIADDFDRALENIPEDLADHPWVKGTALILKKFDKLMEKHAVEVIDPVGEPFDPRLHEAVGMGPSDEYDSGIVMETLQKGYISGETVLRPALVRVAS